MLTLNGGIQIPFLVSKTTTQEFKPSHRVKKESEWEEKEMKEKHHTLFFCVYREDVYGYRHALLWPRRKSSVSS